ncbi:TPA: multidrug transporter, partial [Burkholderia multivorans]|nr:multidrug transporter [Burkholderia multivorans]
MPHAAEQPDQRIALVQAMAGSHLGMALLDRTINQQAAMIAYLNDFKLMFVATLLMIPLLLPIRPPRKG